MYIPRAFEEKRVPVLHDFMRRHSFATLVTAAPALVASHLPILLDPNIGPFGTLRSHMARANDQWQSFTENTEVMVLFEGPHGYISPTWYTVQPSVPTWVYAVVHAYGKPRLIDDPLPLRDLLKKTVDTYESPMPSPWSMDGLPQDYTAKMQEQIVGFEIEITRLEGKFKLNQNRSLVDRQRNIDALRQTAEPLNIAVADLMAERLPAPTNGG